MIIYIKQSNLLRLYTNKNVYSHKCSLYYEKPFKNLIYLQMHLMIDKHLQVINTYKSYPVKNNSKNYEQLNRVFIIFLRIL